MDASLVARRESARDRHDHAWEIAPDGRGPAFESEMAGVVEELDAITVAAGAAPAGGDLDLAKTWRFLGEAWFDLGRVRGNPARARALAAFQRGQAALGGTSAREGAVLMVGLANAAFGLAEGRDVTLLRRAITLYEEALPTVRVEMADDAPGVERSLGHARAILSAASTFTRMQGAHDQLGASAQGLESVGDAPGETVEDRRARLAMSSSISTDAAVAQINSAVASFTAASNKAGTTEKQKADTAELNRMLVKLGTVARVDPAAVRSHQLELDDLSRMRNGLAAELEAERVSPVRRIQLEEVLDELEGILMTRGDDALAMQARNARLKRLMDRASALTPEGLDERLAGLHRAIHLLAMRTDLSPIDAAESKRLFESVARLGPELAAATMAGKPTLHEPRLRALAVDVQRHLRRHNVMLAEPLWDCASGSKDPDSLFFAGAADLEKYLAASSKARGIRLLARPEGGDEGQHRWDQLRNAGAAIFDLRGDPGPALAQTYYELGLATCLGIPYALLSDADQSLPFDVEEPTIVLRNDEHAADRLTGAIDLAYGGAYRGEENDAMTDTLEVAIRLVGAGAATGPTRATVELARQAEQARDATLFGSTLETLSKQMPSRRLQLFHPSHPPVYPTPDTRRMFHVMPFGQPWSTAATEAAESACAGAGVSYVRGDRPDAARVLRSIWNEVGWATHVLVDLTGFNANVAFELGLAHGQGKSTLMVVRGTDGKAGVFPDIAKLQVRSYRDDAALAALIGRFVA